MDKKKQTGLSATILKQQKNSTSDTIRVIDQQEDVVNEVLLTIATTIGCQITSGQVVCVREFLTMHFKALTLTNITRAFNLNASGEFWTTIDHFGNFDIMFVGKVLRAYVEAKRKFNQRNQKNKLKALEAPKIASKEQAQTEIDLIKQTLRNIESKFKVNKESNSRIKKQKSIHTSFDAYTQELKNRIVYMSDEDLKEEKKKIESLNTNDSLKEWIAVIENEIINRNKK